MTITERFMLPSTHPKRTRQKRALRLKCDECGTEFVRDKNVRLLEARENHYCSHKCAERNMKKTGVIGTKRKNTCLERYGAECYIAQPEIATRAAHLANTPEATAKRLATWRAHCHERNFVFKRGLTLMRSKSEIEFIEELSKVIGLVVPQKYANHWFIDGYIPEHNVYVQFDGIYWHSRPERRVQDEEQNAWFASRGVTLVRVTDKEWKANPDECIKRVVESCKSSGHSVEAGLGNVASLSKPLLRHPKDI